MKIYKLSKKCSDKNAIKKYKVCLGIEETGYVAEYGTLKISINKICQLLNDTDRVFQISRYGTIRPKLKDVFWEFKIKDYVYNLTGFEDTDENFDVWITY